MASENGESHEIEKTWWQQRSRKEKNLLIITPITVTIIIAAVVGVYLCVFSSKEIDNTGSLPFILGLPQTLFLAESSSALRVANSDDTKKENCSNPICKVAALLRNAMDTTIDPCEDFYQYSCGNWLSDLNVSISWMQLIQFTVSIAVQNALHKKMNESNLAPAQEKLIDGYKSCINADIEETKMMLIEEIGGMPDFDRQWSENTYDLAESIANASTNAAVSSLIRISVSPDYRNTTRNLITLGPPSYIYDPEPGYSKTWDIPSFLSNRFRRDLSHTLANHSEETKALIKDLQIIFNSSIQIAPEKVYGIYRMSELRTVFPGVNFTKIIQLTTQDALSNIKIRLKEDEEIAITNVEYVKKFAELVGFGKHSLSAYANYIGYNVLNAFNLNQHFEPNTTGNNGTGNAERPTIIPSLCVGFFSNFLDDAVDRLFVDYIRAREKNFKLVFEMIDYIKKAFKTLTRQSKWLDNSTLIAVIDKLNSMRELVGYPPWILDDEKLNAKYDKLPNMDSSFVANVRRIRQFQLESLLRTLREPNDLKKNLTFPGSTTTVNSYYLYQLNAIWLPLGIQTIPFYYEGLPMYLNFGAVGSIIGHEITHGFDTKGSLCDKNGNLYNWWVKDTKKEFDEKAKCFVHQYDAYYDQPAKLNVNGTKTLAENIADNGGIKQSFLAYQNWVKKNGKEQPLPGFEDMTPNQLFFVAFANMFCSHYQPEFMRKLMKQDVHCQSPYRVWGPISNSGDFARTFNCKQGSKMNPKDKCSIW